MLSGSALARIAALLVAAAGLAALVQFLWPRGPVEPAGEPATTVSRPKVDTKRAEPAAAPKPDPAPAPAPVPPPPPPAEPAPPQPTPAPAPNLPPPAPPAPPPLPPVAETPPAADPQVQADENAPPRAVGLVDLNTASLAELNRLRGGGAIGRAIIKGRPYTSVDQLVSKRVLSRGTYDRIKDQVAVQ